MLGMIVAISLYCAKRTRKAIVKILRAVVAPPHVNTSHMTQVWEVDAPTMERFFQEIAKREACQIHCTAIVQLHC